MLTNLSRLFSTWFRPRTTHTRVELGAVPHRPHESAHLEAAGPPPIPSEVLIELDDDLWQDNPDEDLKAWEAVFDELNPRH
jgi:hypothetical protein